MPDESDPPRKHYGFKDRDFKRDNVLAPGDAPMPTAKELAMLATSRSNPSKHAARPASVAKAMAAKEDSPYPKTQAKADDPNDVYTILQENRRSAQQHGLNEVEIKEVKSRRARDFWLVLVGGNLAIIGGVYVSGISVITVVFGLAGLIIFSIGLSWIMWQVMDKF